MPGTARSQPLGGINSCSFFHRAVAKSKKYFESEKKKMEILKGRGSPLWNSEGMGGNAFWNFRRQGGVKTWKPFVAGYGYFLKWPI